MSREIFLTIICLACQVLGHAQVSIGKPKADTSALLDLEAAKKGLLLPRGSQAQRMTIKSPGNGLLYYQVSSPEGFYHYKRGNLLSTWLPAMPYTLQQNMRLGDYSLLGSRLNNLGIVMDKGEVVIQTQLPLASPDIRSLLTVYNGNWIPENNIPYINLVSFKTVFGLNLYSMKLSENPWNYLGIYHNSTAGPIQRFLIADRGILIGNLPPSGYPATLRIDGNLKFTGNLDIGVEYVFVDYTLPAHSSDVYGCKCGLSKMLVSGGGGARDAGSSQDDVTVLNSTPQSYSTWRIRVNNNTNRAKVIRVYAICSNMVSYPL